MSTSLRSVADERARLHAHHASSRPLSVDYELVGLAGEVAFGERFGYAVDLTLRPGGDGRIDFEADGLTLDVKTARLAFNLLREQGKPHADILVLAEYFDETEKARLVGWEWDYVMVQCPTKTFGYGVVNHYKHRSQLRSISLLDEVFPRGDQ